MTRPGPRLLIRLLAPLLLLTVVTACSGIPGSGPVVDVRNVADQAGQSGPDAPPTPVAGQRPVLIVRAFVDASARISLTTDSYSIPRAYLTSGAQKSWQQPNRPAGVQILSGDLRVEPSLTDPATVTVSATSEGSLSTDQAYHSGNGATYRVTVHLLQDKGQWRISDPPPELLILAGDFNRVFSPRTLYFLDASHTVVVPDRRYLIKTSTPSKRLATLINLLLAGPAGVLRGAAQSELKGGTLRTNVTTDPNGLVTRVDLLGIDLATPADKTALAAQIVWSLYPDAVQVAISVDGAPLDKSQASYTFAAFESFSPDRVPGTGSVASDPYYVDGNGFIVDLRTMTPLSGPLGTGSAHVVSAAMSAATGTLAAVSGVAGGQALLIGQPAALSAPQSALKARTLTPPSFTRTGNEAWVVQNGATNPEIYRVSTSPSSTVTTIASRAKVTAGQLNGLGAVTGLTLSPDGVRVAIVAGGRLYLGAIAVPVAAKAGSTNSAAPETPDSLTVINLEQVRGELDDVGPVAFGSANELLVVAKNPSVSFGAYRAITEMNVDGSDAVPVTTTQLPGDIQAMAVSTVDPAAVQSTSNTGTVNGSGTAATSSVYIIWGSPGQPGDIWELKGSLDGGQWVSASTDAAARLTGINLLFPG
ncbi:LpqB family beta-propeller domain-containing protein [Nakamurella sp. PAMC28650]|uniref:LpqB family beta-propeller domain-containing protein n=1 Tax=Nakamurella sp. PAMC28650 TaxID=2762325 RepID=UPI00164D31E1|nr:LpqB family beta-propeller domain-containing protein [Nakamurella sp. PAMC28650]QNK80837.1 GerMN domain-containing protein [Nakamurella sp. PAMC28650]